VKYLGGKSKLAGRIVDAISREVGAARVWEPFCGGGAITTQLARTRDYVASTDVHRPLISMWRALQSGWVPPERLTLEQYTRARSLPDNDPLKAFAGFACSFGGKWFAGLARGGQRADGTARDHTNEASRNVRASIPYLGNVHFGRIDFFAVEPRGRMVLYCDPPYADTEGYKDTALFPHADFWERCRAWHRAGSRVFVSEFACPVKHRTLCVFDRTVAVTQDKSKRVADSLYEVVG